MSRRVLVALVSAACVVGFGAFLGYGALTEPPIAAGVNVGGVDVGGLSREEARLALSRALSRRVGRPITIVHRHRRFRVLPRAVQARLDLEGMVGEAIRASRRQNPLVRAFESAAGDLTADVNLPLRVTYDRQALRRLVAGITTRINRRPRAARVEPSATRLLLLPPRAGLRVDRALLARELAGRLLQPNAPRLVQVNARPLPAHPTLAELRRRYPAYILISRGEKKLRFYRHLRLARVFTIAVGRTGFTTPAGLHRVFVKEVNPSWHAPNEPWAGEFAGKIVPPGPDDPLKARWLGFHDGNGIHGTDDVSSIGEAASHGCIRMQIPDVIELYRLTPLGTPLYIS